MDKTNMKKLLIKGLIVGCLTFGTVNMVPMQVEAAHSEIMNQESLSYEQLHYIKKYSEICNLNPNYVCNCLCNYVCDGDFTTIDGVHYQTEEEAILTFIYKLAFKPDQLGINKKEVVRDETNYEMEKSHEETILYYSNLLEIDPEIALSITYAECGGDLDSYNYQHNNNPAGIGPNKKFNNKEEGIIYYTFLLKYGYNLEKESDEEFFKRIASTYCPDGTEGWIKHTKSFYSKINENYYYYNDELRDLYTKSQHTVSQVLLAENMSLSGENKVKTLSKTKSTNY
ncbi:MAG: hypothetical protein IKP76_04485 [Bacilli bacterium]|nr:hypothetical protein [Bacilli bacterium]